MKCANATGFPSVAALAANDVTAVSSYCSTLEVPVATNRKFVAGDIIPANPLGGNNGVIDCTVAGGDCDRSNGFSGCDGSAFSGGWCYNPIRGDVWPDSDEDGEYSL